MMRLRTGDLDQAILLTWQLKKVHSGPLASARRPLGALHRISFRPHGRAFSSRPHLIPRRAETGSFAGASLTFHALKRREIIDILVVEEQWTYGSEAEMTNRNVSKLA
jgi:hypothetical protein